MFKALNASGEDLCSDRANERVSSKVSLRAPGASLVKQRRLTGTLKLDIFYRSQFSSPPIERSIMALMA